MRSNVYQSPSEQEIQYYFSVYSNSIYNYYNIYDSYSRSYNNPNLVTHNTMLWSMADFGLCYLYSVHYPR